MKKIYALILALTFTSTVLIAQTVHTIMVADFQYTPANPTITLGDTVLFQWVNGSHPTRSDNGTTIPLFNMNSTSTTKKIVLTSLGTVPFYCTAHGGPGGQNMSGTITVTTSTGLNKSASLTNSLQVYPNPASEKINVSFNVKKDNNVNIKLIDVLGNEVATLINEKMSAGEYREQLSIPSRISTGLYFVKISVGNDVAMKRISIQ
jgi:plastocyanin